MPSERRRTTCGRIAVGLAAAVSAVGLAVTYAANPATRPTTASVAPATHPFARVADEAVLHNAFRVTDKVISGAQPGGEQSFRALRDLGVRTIISVDGARPDVDLARRYGLNYVHLPITYGTVTEDQGKAIAKAIDELPGPVYVHCHHGKHRSAAAVAVACVYNGTLAPEQAESVLKTFGTGDNYKGLWKAARDARPLDAQTLRDLKVQYAETAQVPPMADAMVAVDRHWEHLKAIRKAGWKPPPDHPDLDPGHEALQLQEWLHEIGRAEVAKPTHPADFRQVLAESENAADALRAALTAKPNADTKAADAAYQGVANSCVTCHKAYRD